MFSSSPRSSDECRSALLYGVSPALRGAPLSRHNRSTFPRKEPECDLASLGLHPKRRPGCARRLRSGRRVRAPIAGGACALHPQVKGFPRRSSSGLPPPHDGVRGQNPCRSAALAAQIPPHLFRSAPQGRATSDRSTLAALSSTPRGALTRRAHQVGQYFPPLGEGGGQNQALRARKSSTESAAVKALLPFLRFCRTTGFARNLSPPPGCS